MHNIGLVLLFVPGIDQATGHIVQVIMALPLPEVLPLEEAQPLGQGT